ncbi:hypothetical protein HDU96_005584 [Phlyctochytrium bullatum]|nr:hypothetical protein HDU96_005584 [Phlyctochytrium bullatum]
MAQRTELLYNILEGAEDTVCLKLQTSLLRVCQAGLAITGSIPSSFKSWLELLIIDAKLLGISVSLDADMEEALQTLAADCVSICESLPEERDHKLHSFAYITLSKVLSLSGNNESAVTALKKAIEFSPQAVERDYLAQCPPLYPILLEEWENRVLWDINELDPREPPPDKKERPTKMPLVTVRNEVIDADVWSDAILWDVDSDAAPMDILGASDPFIINDMMDRLKEDV